MGERHVRCSRSASPGCEARSEVLVASLQGSSRPIREHSLNRPRASPDMDGCRKTKRGLAFERRASVLYWGTRHSAHSRTRPSHGPGTGRVVSCLSPASAPRARPFQITHCLPAARSTPALRPRERAWARWVTGSPATAPRARLFFQNKGVPVPLPHLALARVRDGCLDF